MYEVGVRFSFARHSPGIPPVSAHHRTADISLRGPATGAMIAGWHPPTPTAAPESTPRSCSA